MMVMLDDDGLDGNILTFTWLPVCTHRILSSTRPRSSNTAYPQPCMLPAVQKIVVLNVMKKCAVAE